ncbi:Fumarylacetoacetate hydrolase family protein [Minicystis rosea]|nr:Fumarylacetoacetate hydrolase family protein [Minicystis rosea]
MRIARVLREDPEEASAHPLLALERDGALYDVGELDRVFGTPYDPDLFPGATDFHTRVIALGGAGLAVLDERLRAGERPTEARLLPGTFVWLPPCDTERALHVQLASDPRPTYRIGNARGLLGNEAPVVFPEDEAHPGYELCVAAVLREDLRAASLAEAEQAILGYAILNAWCGLDDAARAPAASRRVASQLGPVLVSADEIGDLSRLRAQVRVDGQVRASTGVGGSITPAQAIAWLSRWIDLRSGDVVGLGCIEGGDGAAPAGASIELLVERLGKLTGRPVCPA